MTISVLVVDDQDLVRTGMAMLLAVEPGITVVGEAADGDAAVERTAALQPDVVLMDIRMPGMNGIDATRVLTERFPDVRVLALTTFDLDEYVFRVLRAGASGFLLKDVPPDELVAAIRTVASGAAVVSPRATGALLDSVRDKLPVDLRPGEVDGLSDRERDVLLAVARGRNNTEIAAELFLAESTVKTHVGRVMAKLGLRDRVQIVIYAHEHRLV